MPEGELTPEGVILKRVPGIFSGLCFRAAFLKKRVKGTESLQVFAYAVLVVQVNYFFVS